MIQLNIESMSMIQIFFLRQQSDLNENETNVEASNSTNIQTQHSDITSSVDVSAVSSVLAEDTSEEFRVQHDVGYHVNRSDSYIENACKFTLLTEHWTPPVGFTYPYSTRKNKGKTEKRYLRPSHLQQHSQWLVFSPKLNGLLCKWCVLLIVGQFGNNTLVHKTNMPLQNLVKSPLTDYSRLTGEAGVLETHSRNQYHINAVQAGKSFISTMKDSTKTVFNQIATHNQQIIADNRKRLVPIIKSIIFCARQNIALRGHRDDGKLNSKNDENDKMTNEGNFREILKFRVDAGDTDLADHLKNTAANATYISKTVQNEIIEICGEEILKVLTRRIRMSNFYCVIIDETTDIACVSQLSINIRYCYNNEIREDFIGFVDLHHDNYTNDDMDDNVEPVLSGEVIGETVLRYLEKLNFDFLKCIGIATDGCATMISSDKGVITTMQKRMPNAVRIPCFNHALNLSLSEGAKVSKVICAFATIKDTISFFSRSSKRSIVLESKLGGHLHGLCATRWVERHDSVIQFRDHFKSIFESLQSVSKWMDSEASNKAITVMHQLNSEFVMTLHIIADIFTVTLPISKVLQSISLDKAMAATTIEHAISKLKLKRENAETVFASIYAEAMEVIEDLDMDPPVLPRKHINTVKTAEQHIRINVFIPFVDNIINDLIDRFDQNYLDLFDLNTLLPVCFFKLPFAVSEQKKENGFIKVEFNSDIDAHLKYTETETVTQVTNITANVSKPLNIRQSKPCLKAFEKLLKAEVESWQLYWKEFVIKEKKLPVKIEIVLDHCDSTAFEHINECLSILSVWPVSIATAERTFSTLRRLKTWIRSTTKQQRLNGLALMHMNRDINLNVADVIDVFAQKKSRKLDFLL